MKNNTTDSRSKKIAFWRPSLLPILLSIVFLVYGPLLRRHYALDTYVAEAYGNHTDQLIASGRFLSGAISKILTALGVNTAVYQSPFTFVSLCFLALAIYLVILLFFELREPWDKKSFIALCLSCVISFCNVFVLHWFLFPEVVVFMMTGLLLSIASVFFLEGPGAARWVFCFVLLVAALSFYQAVGAIFVTFGILSIVVKREGQPLTSVMRGSLAALTVYILAGVTNMLFIMWHGRSDGRTDFQHTKPLENIHAIMGSIHDKLQNTNLGAAPLYAFSFFMVFLLVGCGFLVWKSSDRKGLSRPLFLLTVLITGSFLATMAPHLLTGTVDVSPRSIVALMSLPGAISLFVFFQLHLSQKPLPLYFLLACQLIFFSVNTYISYRVESSRFATNRLDREIAGAVHQEIVRYEEQTGQTVSRIAFRHDSTPTLCYPGLVCYGNFRAMGRDWTIVPIMTLVAGRRFVETAMPDEIYDRSFKGKDWTSFSKEQLLIRGDTLYLMLY